MDLQSLDGKKVRPNFLNHLKYKNPIFNFLTSEYFHRIDPKRLASSAFV